MTYKLLPSTVLTFVVISVVYAGSQDPLEREQSITPETITQWQSELSNWGRWGQNDQKGALNLITPAKRRQAATLVKAG